MYIFACQNVEWAYMASTVLHLYVCYGPKYAHLQFILYASPLYKLNLLIFYKLATFIGWSCPCSVSIGHVPDEPMESAANWRVWLSSCSATECNAEDQKQQD